MNCEIQSLKDRRRDPGTLPPRGRVNEVKKDWRIHEDGALAYRLQDEEFKQHFHGNKSRNMQIREDFPCAKEQQYREAQEAARLHQQLLLEQEAEDARVAAEIARRLELEESERRKRSQQTDEELAKHLQDVERSRRMRRERMDLEIHTPRKSHQSNQLNGQCSRPSTSASFVSNIPEFNVDGRTSADGAAAYRDNLSDINNVGLPLDDDLAHSMRSCHVYEPMNGQYSPSPPPMSEDEARRLQEEQDAELAKRLQDEEPDPLDPVTRDRLLAIETQDKELARLLWEKERARLRRAKERARAKRRAAEMALEEPLMNQDTATKPKPRYPDPDEIVALPDPAASNVGNIAMVIDPTYPRSRPNGQPDSEQESPVDGVAPPYMPIQGQRRFASVEKKPKGTKDGCKQQ